MTQERSIFFDENTQIRMRKRKGTRRISLRINREGEVRLIVPHQLSFKTAERFVHEKKDWIRKTREKILVEKQKRRIFIEGENCQTRLHTLIVQKEKVEKPKFVVHHNLARVIIPMESVISSRDIQDFIRYCLIEIYRFEAKQLLVKRVHELANKYNFRINQVRIKNMKSRWGSCSAKNNINLNLHLMSLPRHLAHYVIMHELVHTRYRHHRPEFWGELDRYIPNAKTVSKELKNYYPEI